MSPKGGLDFAKEYLCILFFMPAIIHMMIPPITKNGRNEKINPMNSIIKESLREKRNLP